MAADLCDSLAATEAVVGRVLLQQQQELDSAHSLLRQRDEELRASRAALSVAHGRVEVLEAALDRQQAQLALERMATQVQLLRQGSHRGATATIAARREEGANSDARRRDRRLGGDETIHEGSPRKQ
jgi:hypothetical protein